MSSTTPEPPGGAPLVQAFEHGGQTWEAVTTRTIADGIDVGDPYFGRQALDAVARTGGSWIAVTDDDLRSAIEMLAQSSGILAEPAGAAALAGVIAHREMLGASDQTIVALVSGTGLKDQRWLPRAVAGPSRSRPTWTPFSALSGASDRTFLWRGNRTDVFRQAVRCAA